MTEEVTTFTGAWNAPLMPDLTKVNVVSISPANTPPLLVFPASPKADFMVVQKNGLPILTITREGEVIAPDLESASEAGRVFVESIRHHLAAIKPQPPRQSIPAPGQS